VHALKTLQRLQLATLLAEAEPLLPVAAALHGISLHSGRRRRRAEESSFC
jgi:hypothetical protein